ncbi:hypothetical protein AX15_007766 [Amanita polypyramis BW_CC]|nr:hypothetical protein AX15_007766 [Amanita polypyramis BW_CC]
MEGIKKAGGSAELFQRVVEETLSEDVLRKMGVVRDERAEVPCIKVENLPDYDAFLLGIPTRYGNMPAQWKARWPTLDFYFIHAFVDFFQALWDRTGKLWKEGKLADKYVGIFFSTASPGGGQETTALNMMSTLVHHGMIYVPFGYSRSFKQLGDMTEVHGGSAWGAGTISADNNSREPSRLELEIATMQGKQFYEVLSRVKF